jgi:hypothetical protein
VTNYDEIFMFGICTENCWEQGEFGFCPYWHRCIPYLREAQIWFLSILALLHPLLYTEHKFGFYPYWHQCIPYFTQSTDLVFVYIGTIASPTLHKAQISVGRFDICGSCMVGCHTI